LKKAFTLIELLVVIAIIAILAAILFPVFAQAKEAAKDTTALSNVKNVSMAHLIYSSDYDDTFCLTAVSQSTRYAPDINALWGTWQTSILPYTKNWGIKAHPKLSPPSGPQWYWQRIQHFGVMPRAAAVNPALANGPDFVWTQATLTGGQPVHFDGIFGAGIEAGQTWYAMRNAPSISQTAIENIANVIMVTEANNFDLWWGIFGQGYQLGWCSNWGAGWTQPGMQEIFGPHARKRSKVPQSGCRYPDGLTIYAATDGSAKAVDYRGQILSRTQRSDGLWVHPRMYVGAIQ
jgi:prepilin-type N-terminal cleavage/methylation domain-containing protein